MIQGLLELVKSQRDVRGIIGSFADENYRSRRVMEKLGMTFWENVTLSKSDGSGSYPGKRYRRLFENDH